MRTLTFFNAKGGTGKTTFTVLMASWLAYKEGVPVVVYDCDYPSYQLWNMREADKEILKKDPVSMFARLSAGHPYYGIAKAMGHDTFLPAQLKFIGEQIAKMRSEKEGYLLLDFPGRFLPNDPVWFLVKESLLDLVVFPVDTDFQSRADALNTYFAMQKLRRGGQPAAFLWNRETQAERRGRRDWYGDSTQTFAKLGIPVIGQRMRDILIARRDASTFGFIRNTMCWPQANIDKACPYIEDIFGEIKSRLDGTYAK